MINYGFFFSSIFNMKTTFTFRLICLLLYYQYILETWDGETVTHFIHTHTYIHTYIYIYIYIKVVRLQLIPSRKSNSYESFIHLALQVHHTFILLHLTPYIIPKSLLHFLPDYLISTSITFDPLVLSKLCLPLSKKTWSATSLYVMYPTPIVRDNDIHKGSYTTWQNLCYISDTNYWYLIWFLSCDAPLDFVHHTSRILDLTFDK